MLRFSKSCHEYISFNDFCEKEGIIHEMTPPYSLESNDVAERKNRTLRKGWMTC